LSNAPQLIVGNCIQLLRFMETPGGHYQLIVQTVCPRVFLFELRTALASPTQKEKFINRKTSGWPARSPQHWRSVKRQHSFTN
jgi:hypothetical protein